MTQDWPGHPLWEADAQPELLESLGLGSLGETFLARHPRTGQQIAVTRFHPSIADHPFLRDFETRRLPELHAFARPGIVPISSFFRIGDELAFAMPYFAGEDIRRYRGRTVAEILGAFRPMLITLGECHSAGFVHGGLRPANLLCDPEGGIQIAGLGLGELIHGLDEPRQHRLRTAGAELSPALRAGSIKPVVADDMFALGSLLYEWISGRPPPPVDPSGHQVLPPIVQPGRSENWSREMSVLIARMRQADPLARPPSIASLLADLGEILDKLPKQPTTPRKPTAAASTVVVPREPPEFEPREIEKSVDHEGAIRKAWWTLLAVALAGVALLYWLETKPDPVVESAAIVVDAQPSTREPEITPPEAPAVSSFEDERKLAELANSHAELLERLRLLEDRGSADWASEETQLLRASLESMDDARKERNPADAESAASRSLELVVGLEGEASELLDASLRAGALALERDEVDEATGRFTMALRLDPDSGVAKKGLERAAKRPALLEEVARARAAADRRDGLTQAIRLARQASSLDPEYEPARTLLRTLERRRAAQALAIALAEHRQKAERFEAQEQWAEAVAEYEAALARKKDAEFARISLPRARERAALDDRIAPLAQAPKTIFNPKGRKSAREALEKARLVTDPGPRLQQQVQIVEHSLELAETPVSVTLISDDRTEVAVFHVGRQGTFDRKGLQLLPGTYTVVGSRNGYRDVRRTLEVEPGTPTMSFVVRCEEAL